MLILALVLNLSTGNGLWLAYTLVGVLAYAILFVLDRRGKLDVPSRTLMAMAIVASLHFLGGSLAGVHSVFGVNGAYYVLPWWDNVAHFLGGAVGWMFFDFLFRARMGLEERRVATSLAAVGFTAMAGIGVELYEFSGFLFFGTIDQGFYTNTMLDLYYDLLGAGAAAIAIHRWAAWFSRAETSHGPEPAEA